MDQFSALIGLDLFTRDGYAVSVELFLEPVLARRRRSESQPVYSIVQWSYIEDRATS
jgi:hypothetical protein